jgi:drug/metabolite transporter (DMT)-like permease
MTAIPSPAAGRWFIVLAALLWSLSGAFKSVLTHPTSLGLHDPPLTSLQIAFFRALFAGLALLPLVRRSEVRFKPACLGMVATFALMNVTYVTALTQGPAANAIWLQYTGPLWMYLACVYLLGEPPDRRGLVTLLIGLVGVAVILVGAWLDPASAAFAGSPSGPWVTVLAAISGLFYAGVLVWLRALRDDPPAWLTVLNHLGTAGILALAVWHLPLPTPGQLVFLAIFGTVQMAVPYWLIARGLRSISPQEAGTLTLLEPLLNPLWAYLVAPQAEVPSRATLIGGAIILAALAWRYAPRRKESE